MGKILSLNISTAKGIEKTPVDTISVVVDHGFEGDAHAGSWHRQISLLAIESINSMLARRSDLNLQPGSFAENITTEGIDLCSLPVGTRLSAGEVELEVSQIGKKCHAKCNIFHKVGDCVMPREGIFAKVIRPGTMRRNDELHVIPKGG